MFEEFRNKVLFVTGAASGMGRAVAVRFGSYGCKVAVAARKPDKAQETVRLVEETGGEAIFVPCDVADEASVKAAIDKTVETFGGLDYAFNNAGCGADGVNIPFAPLTEVTEGDWLWVIIQQVPSYKPFHSAVSGFIVPDTWKCFSWVVQHGFLW